MEAKRNAEAKSYLPDTASGGTPSRARGPATRGSKRGKVRDAVLRRAEAQGGAEMRDWLRMPRTCPLKPMPCYYAYLIDADGRIAKREVIMCDDDEAKRVAKQ
jgi:hypothetical protein